MASLNDSSLSTRIVGLTMPQGVSAGLPIRQKPWPRYPEGERLMSFYEHIFVVRQDLAPAQVDEVADRFAAVIEKEGGKVTKRENWGLRNLAYRIQKNRKGYYVLFNIDAPADAVKELERTLRIDEDILRHLTIKVDALEEGPSVMLAPKANKKEENDELFDSNGNESEAF